MRTISITGHEKRVRAMECLISQQKPVQLHHVHGGSVTALFEEHGIEKRGVGQKVSDYLVIPIHYRFHTGEFGIDNGLSQFGKDVSLWERQFGSQVRHLEAVCKAVGYNVFKLAGINRHIEGVDNDVVPRS